MEQFDEILMIYYPFLMRFTILEIVEI